MSGLKDSAVLRAARSLLVVFTLTSFFCSSKVSAQPSNWPTGAPWPLTVIVKASDIATGCSGNYIITFSGTNAVYTRFHVNYWYLSQGPFTLFSYYNVGNCSGDWGVRISEGWDPAGCAKGWTVKVFAYNTAVNAPASPASLSSSVLDLSGTPKNTTCYNFAPFASCNCIPLILNCSATQSNVVCSGQSNGTAAVSVDGSHFTTSFSYSWSGGATTTGNATYTISGLAAGNSTVTVTDGSNTATCPLQIAEFSNNVTVTQPGCGVKSGSITAAGINGSGNYSYHWNTGATTATITGLSSGNYCVTVTDNTGGCTISGCQTIRANNQTGTPPNGWPCDAPWPITIEYDKSQYASGCSGKSAFTFSSAATYSPGFGAYFLYETITLPSGGTLNVRLTNNFDDKCSGPNYVLEMHDPTCRGGSATCCSGNAQFTYRHDYADARFPWENMNPTIDLTQLNLSSCVSNSSPWTSCTCLPPNSNFNCSATQTGVVCAGLSNGTALVNVTNATTSTGYSYSWNGGSTTTSSTTLNITGLAPGSFEVTVTSGANTAVCEVQMQAFSHGINVTQPVCGTATGSMAVTASNGSGNYSYLWNTGATTANISGLTAGNYCVTVTDNSAGCIGTGCKSPSIQTGTPPSGWPCDAPWPITVEYNKAQYTNDKYGTACPGTAEFTFSSAATYTLNTSSSFWKLSETINLPSGGTLAVELNYSWATSKYCSNPYWTFSMTYPIACTKGGSSSCCGTATFSYDQNIGTIPSASLSPTVILQPGNMSYCGSNFSNWSDCACLPPNSASPPISCTITNPTVACFGENNGTALVLVSGGNSGTSYSYTWNGGSASNGTSYSIGNLAAGAYTVTVTQGIESTTCAVSITGSSYQIIPFYRPSAFGNANISVLRASDGSILTYILGGIAPYTYTWRGPSRANGANPTGLRAGSYFLEVTDQNGCHGFAGPWNLNEP